MSERTTLDGRGHGTDGTHLTADGGVATGGVVTGGGAIGGVAIGGVGGFGAASADTLGHRTAARRTHTRNTLWGMAAVALAVACVAGTVGVGPTWAAAPAGEATAKGLELGATDTVRQVAATGEKRTAARVDLPRYPSISPDGGTIAFTWRGDVWTVPVAGGLATRLTTTGFDELWSAFSPDGKRLAFTSTRTGSQHVFTVGLDGSGLTQVTQGDYSWSLSQWGRNEKGEERLMLQGLMEPVPFPNAMSYEVRPEGGVVDRVMPAAGGTPVASPDGKRVLFTRGAPGSTQWVRRGYRGADARDVWVFDRTTKQYTRLTAFDGNDGKPKWLDNDTVVFISNRLNKTNNLFALKVGQPEAAAKPLTRFEGDGVEDADVATGAAGKTIVFTRWNKLYTMNASSLDATPREVVVRGPDDEGDSFRFQDVRSAVSEADLSPDGKAVAIIAYGELYVRGTESRAVTRRIGANLPGRKRSPVWSADGERVLFVSDAAGREELYQATVKTTRGEIRRKVTGEEAAKPGATTSPAGPASAPTTSPATAAESAAPSHDEAAELTDASGEQVRRMPPGMTIPGMPSAGGSAGGASAANEPSRWGDAITFEVKKLWDSPTGDWSPTPLNDGRHLAYIRLPGKLILRDEVTGTEKTLVDHFEPVDFRFSPDGKYLAYAAEDRNNNADVWIMPVDGSDKPVNVSRHPQFDGSPRWSADGKILAWLSNRGAVAPGTGINAASDVHAYVVNLDRELDAMATPEREAYFRDAAAAARRRTPPATRPATQPTTQAATQAATRGAGGADGDARAMAGGRTRRGASTRPTLNRADLEDAYLRARQVTQIAGGVSNLQISPAGDRYYFVGSVAGQRGLLSQSREAAEPTRIADAGDIQAMSLTGDSLTVLVRPSLPTAAAGADDAPRPTGGARVGVVRLPGGDTEFYDPSDRLRVDLQALSRQKFLEMSRIMANNFYDVNMNGVDWKANTEKYLPLAMAARTPSEFDFVANRFIGELNASHLGVSSRDGASSDVAQSSGHLGISATRVEAGFRVDSVTADGPGDRGAMKLKKLDVITAIDGTPFAALDTLEKALSGKVGVECVVSVTRDGKPIDLLITPTTSGALSSLAYTQWRVATAKKVEEMSGGKIGYIHVRSMDRASLETYRRDLSAAMDGKKGMIVDVRWNGGGSTADLLLASFMAPVHAYTVPRGAPVATDSYPSDRMFIPRFIGPMNMLCNERSFSNAEIISHAFKTLKRGTLVGNTTAGGVISTGGTSLLDGTSVRLPGRGWYLPDGTNMELNGAQPDILIVQTPEDETTGDDRQLKAAVEDLMKRLK